MGVTIFVASGDNGTTDGDPNGTLEVDFPASCPHMTGGGTKLVLSAGTITSEVAWNELSQQGFLAVIQRLGGEFLRLHDCSKPLARLYLRR